VVVQASRFLVPAQSLEGRCRQTRDYLRERVRGVRWTICCWSWLHWWNRRTLLLLLLLLAPTSGSAESLPS
jgi:hypothetical protein